MNKFSEFLFFFKNLFNKKNKNIDDLEWLKMPLTSQEHSEHTTCHNS